MYYYTRSAQGRATPTRPIHEHPTSIRVTTVDGAKKRASQRVQVPGDRVATLEAKPLRLPEAAYMCMLLQQTNMPKLTTLVVNYEDSASPTTAKGVATAPSVWDIPFRQFPSLHSIYLEGVAITLTPSLASQLCALTMGSPEGPQLGLPLAPFLDCLASFSHMETLNLQGCFEAPIAQLGVLGARPIIASRLRDVRITDYPPNVSRIMSGLVVPASAWVILGGEVRGASLQQCCSAFTEMLPRDRACLPVLHSVAKIDVMCVLDDTCKIAGEQLNGRGRLYLELLTDFELDPSVAAGEARGALFRTMVQTLQHVFPAQTVSHLTFAGPVDYISLQTWFSALSPFLDLRFLSVDDEMLRNFSSELLGALIKRSHEHRTVMCPQLEELELYGDFEASPDTDPLHDILLCLERRKMCGGRNMLRKLTVELFSNGPLAEGLLEHYRGRFSRLAQECSLENRVMPGHRTR